MDEVPLDISGLKLDDKLYNKSIQSSLSMPNVLFLGISSKFSYVAFDKIVMKRLKSAFNSSVGNFDGLSLCVFYNTINEMHFSVCLT